MFSVSTPAETGDEQAEQQIFRPVWLCREVSSTGHGRWENDDKNPSSCSFHVESRTCSGTYFRPIFLDIIASW